ncbi:Uncharacterised protein [uncultured archaeon]|nr:Uncharacterised protein [uncultured archaeon]
MQDKFSYYDFIANIIPGILILWGLNFASMTSRLLQKATTNNIATDTLTFIVLAYILGLAIQFLAKNSIEILLKHIFWKDTFFSELYLIKEANLCFESTREKILEYATNKFGYSKKQLNVLNTKNIFANKTKLNLAMGLSQQIYRSLDAYTSDNSLAQKAHLQNIKYSMFRGISLAFFVLSIIILLENIVGLGLAMKYFILPCIFFIGFLLFFIITKQRGELYIKGLFNTIFYKD